MNSTRWVYWPGGALAAAFLAIALVAQEHGAAVVRPLPKELEADARDFKVSEKDGTYRFEVKQPNSPQVEEFVLPKSSLPPEAQQRIDAWTKDPVQLPGSVIAVDRQDDGSVKLSRKAVSIDYLQADQAKAHRWAKERDAYRTAIEKLDEQANNPKSIEDAAKANEDFREVVGQAALEQLAQADSEELRTLARGQHQLEREHQALVSQVPKAYLGKDRFAPDAYRRLLSNQQRVAAIFSSADAATRIGTGLFVGKNIVLTAAHVAEDLYENEAIVCLATENGANPLFRVKGIQLASQLPQTDAAYGDLALLGVEPLDLSVVPNFPPLALAQNTKAIAIYDALYVVSSTEARDVRPLIYDSTSVLFPEWVRGRQLGMVMLNGVGKYMQHTSVEAALPYLPDDMKAVAYAILKAYAYPENAPPSSSDALFGFRQQLGQYSPHYRCGFNSDTKQGDSGSAVFLKSSGALIGVFSSGSDAENPGTLGNWIHHEQSVGLHVIRPFLELYLNKPEWTLGLPQKPSLDFTL
jgi:hypothetical protein